MSEDGTCKKVASLIQQKDGAYASLTALVKEGEDANSKMEKVETLVAEELREYMSQNKTRRTSMMKAATKKLQGKGKPRKRRTIMYPIVASAIKFHKDDDMDSADAGAGSAGTA